jgi:DNA-binding XRE family transcriptional regulator
VRKTRHKKTQKKFSWDLSAVPPFVIWNTIKSLRERLGKKQIEVAVESGVSLATLVFLEAGYDRGTGPEIKEKLSRFFGVPVSAIFPVERLGTIPVEEYLQKKIAEDKKAADFGEADHGPAR